MDLPLFPLHHVLFPGRSLPLHVFEPRYRRMLADCLDGDRRFGVVAIREGREAGAGASLFPVGTIARIESVRELDQGRSNLATRGCDRFRILRLLPDDPYPHAEVELIAEPPPDDTARAAAQDLRALLAPYLTALGAPEELLTRLPDDPDALAYLTGATAQIDLREQQRLLACETPAARVATALSLLRREAGLARHLGAIGSLRPSGPCGAELN